MDTQLAGAPQHAVLVGQRRAPGRRLPDLLQQIPVRPADGLPGTAGQERQVGGRVFRRRQFGQGVHHKTGRDLDHLHVEGGGVEEVLPVFVGLPGTVENAGEGHLVLAGKICPELSTPTLAPGSEQAVLVPLVVGDGPGEVDGQAVVQFARIAAGGFGRLVGAGEDPPLRGGRRLTDALLVDRVQVAVLFRAECPARHRAGRRSSRTTWPTCGENRWKPEGNSHASRDRPCPGDRACPCPCRSASTGQQRRTDDGGGPLSSSSSTRSPEAARPPCPAHGPCAALGASNSSPSRSRTPGTSRMSWYDQALVKAEASGATEELVSVTTDRLHAHAEPADLTAVASGHAHAQDGLRTLGGHRIALVGAVEMGVVENDVNPAARLVTDLVGGVLDQLEELTVAVPALG